MLKLNYTEYGLYMKRVVTSPEWAIACPVHALRAIPSG